MGSFISLPIAFLIHKVFKFRINGNPFQSLICKLRQLFRISNIKKKRFDFFDPRALNDLKKIGLLPNEKEFELELPNQSKKENISIVGLNSWGQALHLRLNWRPQTSKTAAIDIDLTFEDGKGNTFRLNEINLVSYDINKREYKAPGISIEILNPFRRLRIKFRGYLYKNDSNELVYVKLRLLWIAISNVFDLQCDHNQQFIEQEIGKNSKSNEEIKFEDRFEQFGQMKGTIQFNNDTEEKVFLWGNKSKKYDDTIHRKVNRLFGFSKKGWIFHIGSVVDESKGVSYRYGFVFWGKTLIFPIDFLSDIDLKDLSLVKERDFSLSAIDKVFNVAVSKGRLNKNILEIKINGHSGRAVYMKEDEEMKFEIPKCEIHFSCCDKTNELVLPLTNRKAENVLISGGKGSSLSSLTILSKQLEGSQEIIIPNGIIVTCNAYELIKRNKKISDSIKKLKTLISKTHLLKKECENVVNTIKSVDLPQQIKDEIRSNLECIYTKDKLKSTLFAVRSSASSEDSDEMSAAGQMTTYLGIKGLDAIYSAVMNCWSSQFEFVAVEYKRGYGQDIDSLMAVVIQEMVDCDSAGVLFTCDPLTGDEREMIITANYGIGESVVSAMAEPDTIRITVNIKDNSFNNRTIGGIKSITIGSKAKCIKINDSEDGTVEIDIKNQNKCCISDENSITLANIALNIQKFYGSVRDIEWGIKDDRIFILQSRPVTNLDSNFTEFELMHELDVGLPSEREYLSKANVGEVIPGCTSHINATFFMGLWFPIIITDLHDTEGLPLEFYCPYAPTDFGRICNHFFLNLKNSGFFKLSDENESDYTKALIIAIFGHEITDPDIREDCRDVSGVEPLMTRFWRQFYLWPYMIYPKYFVNHYKNTIHNERYVLDGNYSTSSQMFTDICRKSDCIMGDAMIHGKTSSASSMFNHYIFSLLCQEKNNPDMYTDFAFLMSECGGLVSADVPSALRQLAQSIEDPQKFRELSDEKALEYLQSGNSKSSQNFTTFIQTHGHRGYKEFDPLCKTWGHNPLPVINSLKAMLTGDAFTYKAHNKTSTAKIISSLKTPLSFHRKLLLKYVVLPLARRAVAMREETKSLLIYALNLSRQAMWILADKMHSEGLIPELDLIFHMTVYEIDDYMKTRNPLLVTKAKQRKKLYVKMNDWKFDEIVKGYDFIPRDLLENNYANLSDDHVIKGTPVSLGKIVARVCVAPNLEDAVHIKPGDILVTYSTDIGWSPYFPMISGIATEIGGLVSHGAVIAREYGLPCLVGANGATHVFKTGDMVLLDCQKGIMTKVTDQNQNQVI